MLKDADYRENIWKSKINLAFITELNEEDVVHKAFEIAACRGSCWHSGRLATKHVFKKAKKRSSFLLRKSARAKSVTTWNILWSERE